MKPTPKIARPARINGFTLVELMIGVLIALLTVLLVTEVYINAISRQRDVAGGSDAQQTASMTLNQIVSSLKQAGSSMVRSKNIWGCKLQASKNGTTLLPKVPPAPFNSLPATLRLVPAISRLEKIRTNRTSS